MKKTLSLIAFTGITLGLSLILFSTGSGGCGSSSSRGADSGDDTGSDTGTTVEVTDLSTLPSLDLTAADTTASSLSLLPGLKTKNASVGEVSASCCVATQFFKPLALKRLQEAEVFKCYVAATQDGANSDSDASNDISIPTDDYGWFQVTFPDQIVRARLGNFVADSSNTFKMDVCFSNDAGCRLLTSAARCIDGNAQLLQVVEA